MFDLKVASKSKGIEAKNNKCGLNVRIYVVQSLASSPHLERKFQYLQTPKLLFKLNGLYVQAEKILIFSSKILIIF